MQLYLCDVKHCRSFKHQLHSCRNCPKPLIQREFVQEFQALGGLNCRNFLNKIELAPEECAKPHEKSGT